MFWVLEGLGRNGNIAPALEIIDLYYGHLIENGSTTWWENFNADLNRQNSLSHGWGGAPTWFLSTYLLGFRQTGPDSFLLQPGFSHIPQVEGVIPLGDSSVQISLQTTDCNVTGAHSKQSQQFA